MFGQYPLQVNGFKDLHECLEAAMIEGEIESLHSENSAKSGQEVSAPVGFSESAVVGLLFSSLGFVVGFCVTCCCAGSDVWHNCIVNLGWVICLLGFFFFWRNCIVNLGWAVSLLEYAEYHFFVFFMRYQVYAS